MPATFMRHSCVLFYTTTNNNNCNITTSRTQRLNTHTLQILPKFISVMQNFSYEQQWLKIFFFFLMTGEHFNPMQKTKTNLVYTAMHVLRLLGRIRVKVTVQLDSSSTREVTLVNLQFNLDKILTVLRSNILRHKHSPSILNILIDLLGSI